MSSINNSEQSFEEDKKLYQNLPENQINLYNDHLYLDKFKLHRQALSFFLTFHSTSMLIIFLQYKYKSLKDIKIDKLSFFCYVALFYLSSQYLEDFKYCLFRKNKEFGFIKGLKNYNRDLYNKIKNFEIKNYYPKSKNELNDEIGKSSDIHNLLKDLDKLDKEYKSKLDKLSNSSLKYTREYKEIENIKIMKKEIERRILENSIHKNKLI